MQVVVTGATGFIGPHVCRELLKQGKDVACLARRYSWLARIPSECRTGIGETRNVKSNIEYIAPKVDAVIHLATMYKKEYQSHEIPQLLEANIDFSTQVLIECAARGARLFIDTGSYMEHGRDTGPPFQEDEAMSPSNLYAASKVAFSVIAKSLCRDYGMEYRCLRLFSPYGPDDISNKFVPSLMRCIEAGSRLRILNGDDALDFTYVSDIARAYAMAVDAQCGSETINIASGVSTTLRSFIEIMERHCSKPIAYFSEPTREPKCVLANISKAKRLLGWEPMIGIEQGIHNLF